MGDGERHNLCTGPVRRQWINKSGSKEKRPLGIPTVRDRIVQTAIRDTVEPIFEQTFAKHSYGFRPKRGCKKALRQVDNLLKRGYTWVVDADIKSYFDSIRHSRLMERVEGKISDGRMLALMAGFLKQGVMEGLKYYEPEEGTPQGAVISPLLANIYLNPLDKEMAEQGVQMVRYADDFVVLCQTEEEATQVLERIQQWMAGNGLKLHPTKTRIIDAGKDGFEFLGYRFDRGRRWPRKKSFMKFKDSIRGKTKRTNGTSLRDIIAELNQTSRGWFEYFKHSNRPTFRILDQMIRRRLRTILRKRRGRKGVSRGWQDHQRWTNDLSTGEPDAGNPPVRFGGWGSLAALPTPITSQNVSEPPNRFQHHQIAGTQSVFFIRMLAARPPVSVWVNTCSRPHQKNLTV
ncbi:MAG TPA: group II intron reverse transcriptase/maturase [Acidobacteriota bacterium]